MKAKHRATLQRYLVFTKKFEINPDRVHYRWLVFLYTSKRVTAIAPILSESVIKELYIYSYVRYAATYSYSSTAAARLCVSRVSGCFYSAHPSTGQSVNPQF